MKSSEILWKGIKNTVFSECVCSGTSCCCWVLHKMFFWASEIVSFILLRRLQKFQRRKNTFRSLCSADILGDFSIFWWLMSSWESFILQKNTHLMVPAFQKSRIPFFYHWNIFTFLTVCVQINWIQRRPLGVQEIVMSFVQNHYLTFQSLNSRVTHPKDIKQTNRCWNHHQLQPSTLKQSLSASSRHRGALSFYHLGNGVNMKALRAGEKLWFNYFLSCVYDLWSGVKKRVLLRLLIWVPSFFFPICANVVNIFQ